MQPTRIVAALALAVGISCAHGACEGDPASPTDTSATELDAPDASSGDATAETDGAPADAAAETDSAPTDVAAETDSAPTDVAAETDVAPADVSAETDSAPTDVGAETDSAPADVGAETDSAPADVAAETDGAPADVAAETDGAPADVAAETDGAPADVAAETDGAPEVGESDAGPGDASDGCPTPLFLGTSCEPFLTGCFEPDLAGVCTDTGLQLTWGDGHKIVRAGNGPGFYAPSASGPCITLTFDLASYTSTLTRLSNGQVLTNRDNRDGTITITCPAGEVIMTTPAEGHADNLCRGVECPE